MQRRERKGRHWARYDHNDGSVARLALDSGELKGASEAACILEKLRAVRVPAYSGPGQFAPEHTAGLNEETPIDGLVRNSASPRSGADDVIVVSYSSGPRLSAP